MSGYQPIIVTRNLQALTPTTPNFKNFGGLDCHKRFIEPRRTYSSLAAVVADGFLPTDPSYLEAQRVFAQNPAPRRWVSLRRAVDVVTLLVNMETGTEVYTDTLFFEGDPEAVTYTVRAAARRILTFTTDILTGQTIAFKINGVTTGSVPFNASNAQTLTDLAAAIGAMDNLDAVVNGANSLLITSTDESVLTFSTTGNVVFTTGGVIVTGAGTLATGAITNGSTAALIAAALVAALNGGSQAANLDATDEGSGLYTVETATATTSTTELPWTFLWDTNQQVNNLEAGVNPLILSGARLTQQDLASIRATYTDWYAFDILNTTSPDPANDDPYAWAEATPNVLICGAFSDSNITDTAYSSSSPTDLPSRLKAAGYDRSISVFHADAETNVVDAGWIAKFLGYQPGSRTAAFLNVNGVTPSTLSDSQFDNTQAKNCNVYVTNADVPVMTPGKVASGRFIDNIVFLDWFVSQLMNALFVLVSTGQVPFNADGEVAFENVFTEQWRKGVMVGGIDGTVAQIISIPDKADVPAEDRAERLWTGMQVTFTLKSYVQGVAVQLNILF